jgi:hypothetical protein
MRVVWTDESTFNTADFGHRQWVIRRPDEEYHPDCIDERWESGKQSVMIWRAFCGPELKSNIYFVPSGSKIDFSFYTTTILNPLLIPFWYECCEEYGWVRVVEDGAPGHKKYSIRCRERNNMDSIDWPPQSPDLNLIEALWAHMETELGETFGRISDLKTLKEVLKNTWDNTITRDMLDNLIKSMSRRLAAVIAAGGDATPY